MFKERERLFGWLESGRLAVFRRNLSRFQRCEFTAREVRTSSEGPDRSAPLEKRAVRSVWSVGGEPEKLTERARRLKRREPLKHLATQKFAVYLHLVFQIGNSRGRKRPRD